MASASSPHPLAATAIRTAHPPPLSTPSAVSLPSGQTSLLCAFHVSGLTPHAGSRDRLLSLSTMFPRLVHGVGGVSTVFLCVASVLSCGCVTGRCICARTQTHTAFAARAFQADPTFLQCVGSAWPDTPWGPFSCQCGARCVHGPAFLQYRGPHLAHECVSLCLLGGHRAPAGGLFWKDKGSGHSVPSPCGIGHCAAAPQGPPGHSGLRGEGKRSPRPKPLPPHLRFRNSPVSSGWAAAPSRGCVSRAPCSWVTGTELMGPHGSDSAPAERLLTDKAAFSSSPFLHL